jgi:hypothetical protein
MLPFAAANIDDLFEMAKKKLHFLYISPAKA